jgi:hypothetical protein
MAEYIEREATIEFIRLNYCKDCNNYNGILCRSCSFDDAMLAIEDVPAADVVEVVRCKECKHSSFIKSCSKYECKKGCGSLKYSNDYCSYGERKCDK